MRKADDVEFQSRVIASLSGILLKLAAGPMATLNKATEGGNIDAATLASLSTSLRKLAHQASLTASLSAVFAKTAR